MDASVFKGTGRVLLCAVARWRRLVVGGFGGDVVESQTVICNAPVCCTANRGICVESAFRLTAAACQWAAAIAGDYFFAASKSG